MGRVGGVSTTFVNDSILDKMLEHGSQDRATLPLPPCNVGSCRLRLTTLQGEGSGKGWWCFNDCSYV